MDIIFMLFYKTLDKDMHKAKKAKSKKRTMKV